MEAIKNFLQQDWLKLVIPISVLIGALVVGFIAKRLLFRALRRWAANTDTHADDIFIQAFSGPFMIWVVMLSLHLAAQSSTLSEKATVWIGKSLLILWIISLTIVISNLASNLIKYYGGEKQGTLPVTSLTQNLARIVVFIIGALLLLNSLGVSIAPLLTALGVGGLAVALALQDTLSNLFAGFYISLAGHIRIGDYIKLDSGNEGCVADITWRSTTMETTDNYLIVIPNAKLAQAIIINYDLPGKPINFRIRISVSYDNDPEQIERILIEEAVKAARETPGMLPEPAPYVRFIPGFGESSMDFTLYCQITDFEQQFRIQHELRKRIFKRFREAGIEIPFPSRTVYLRNAAEADGQPENLNLATKKASDEKEASF